MFEYKSIETIFVRDPQTHLLELGKIRIEETSLITSWVVTEKVDGMNIRAIFRAQTTGVVSGEAPILSLEVRGRTNAAQLPTGVEAAVRRAFSEDAIAGIGQLWRKEFLSGQSVTFYGEAFGEKIQGNPLRMAGIRFRVFDLLVRGTVWLSDSELRGVCDPLNIPTVPIIGLLNRVPRTEAELDSFARTSQIATEGLRPEGIVGRPQLPLSDAHGNRIIWKLTYREFDKIRKVAEAIAATTAAAFPAVPIKTDEQDLNMNWPEPKTPVDDGCTLTPEQIAAEERVWMAKSAKALEANPEAVGV